MSEEILATERETIFKNRPAYLGCIASLPGPACYKPLEHFDSAFALAREGDTVRMMSNVCLHRGMLMHTKASKSKSIVCPMHKWAYDLSGKLVSTPHFNRPSGCQLEAHTVWNWNGILFSAPTVMERMLLPLAYRLDLNVAAYHPCHIEHEAQALNWKIPVEAFLENYHVPAIHKGLSRFIHPSTCFSDSQGFDSNDLIYQEIPSNPDFASNPDSVNYERWQRAILKICNGKAPTHAVFVVYIFPNILLEWYPYFFVATTYIPSSAKLTTMYREYYYDRTATLAVPDYADLAMAAWKETQSEDDGIHVFLQSGREKLYAHNPAASSGIASYQAPAEDSVRCFHQHLVDLVTGTSRQAHHIAKAPCACSS